MRDSIEMGDGICFADDLELTAVLALLEGRPRDAFVFDGFDHHRVFVRNFYAFCEDSENVISLCKKRG